MKLLAQEIQHAHCSHFLGSFQQTFPCKHKPVTQKNRKSHRLRTPPPPFHSFLLTSSAQTEATPTARQGRSPSLFTVPISLFLTILQLQTQKESLLLEATRANRTTASNLGRQRLPAKQTSRILPELLLPETQMQTILQPQATQS